MSRYLPNPRYGVRCGQGLLAGLLVLLTLAGSAAAQNDSTPVPILGAPQTGSTASAPAASDPNHAQTASGDLNTDRQIGIDLDEADEDERRNLHRVDDQPGLLDLDERIELADDAQRLTNHGLPTIVVIREVVESPEQSQQVADQLRVERGVATRQGADDGLLMLVTVDPDSPRSTSVILSFGANALPKGGLDVETAEAVHDDVMVPRLKRGRLYSALHVGIRRIIYLETYIPDPQPPLSNIQRTVRSAINVAGPLALIGGATAFILAGRRRAGGSGRGRFARTAAVIGFGAVVLFAASVIGRNAIGIASAALLALLIWTQYLIGGGSGNDKSSSGRRLTLPARRQFQPLRRTLVRTAMPGRRTVPVSARRRPA